VVNTIVKRGLSLLAEAQLARRFGMLRLDVVVYGVHI
jgi:hypothetical protein